MNLGTLRTQVRYNIGETSADFWADAELNSFINEGLHRFCSEERWPWLITEGTSQLLAADPDLQLTEGVAFSRHVSMTLQKSGDTRFYQPKRVSAAKGFELRGLYSTVGTSSYPEWFYITSVADGDDDGAYIWVARFVPTPTSDMDVDFLYTRTPAELAADNETPDIPTEYHKALVHWAAGTAWLKELTGGTKAREQFELYAGVVEQARNEWLKEPDDTPLVMGKDEPQYSISRPSPWGDWDPQFPETL